MLKLPRLAIAFLVLTTHVYAAPTTAPAPLTAGTTRRPLTVDGRPRSYLVHVPPHYDPTKPTPVVLAFHGAFMNGAMMSAFTALDRKADAAGFIVVYPNGLGATDVALFFNASATPTPDGPADDVAFTAKLLDDLATVSNVDPHRVFATGLSNGGMLCHRLAAELSDRIAAIAPVAGTLALPAIHPTRPVPVLHFHGTADPIVPFTGRTRATPLTMQFRSVKDTIDAWLKADHSEETPTITTYPDKVHDGTAVRRLTYPAKPDCAEVVLIEITAGGHTWPSQDFGYKFLGKSTSVVSANDLMWDFFVAHPMK